MSDDGMLRRGDEKGAKWRLIQAATRSASTMGLPSAIDLRNSALLLLVIFMIMLLASLRGSSRI